MTDPSTPQDRTAFRKSLRETAYSLPGPSDPETWTFPGPPDFSGTMPSFPATAPDLVNPHEPSEACGGTHCYWHNVDESDVDAYRVCGECGHVYRTAEDLRKAWVDTAADGHAPEVPTSAGAPPAEQIYACPLCCHDW